MSTQPPPPHLEKLLRSVSGRILVGFLIVAVVSLGMSAPRFELAESPDSPVSRWQLFRPEFLRWSAWALLAWPIVGLARWVLGRSGSWLVLFMVQLPVSTAVGYLFLELDFALRPPVPARMAESLAQGPGGRRDFEGRPRRRPVRPGELRAGRGRPGDHPVRDRGRFDSTLNLDAPYWQYRWILSILIYWVILVMGGGVRSFLDSRDKERHAADLELRAERLRARLARAQLDTLTSQLNPHFLFNALHSVGGLVRAGEEQAALKTLAAIGELLRATLDHGDVEEVELASELQIAQRYLDIERIRLGDRLRVQLDVDGDIGAALVPALLLLPLVENAVRHGVSDLPEGGSVTLSARRRGPSLEIEVVDTGLGFPAHVLASGAAEPGGEHCGIGLENTRSRLFALYGQSQRFELETPGGGGARVRVVLPYHEETQDES